MELNSCGSIKRNALNECCKAHKAVFTLMSKSNYKNVSTPVACWNKILHSSFHNLHDKFI